MVPHMIDAHVNDHVWGTVVGKTHCDLIYTVKLDVRLQVQHVVGTPLTTVETQVCYPTEDQFRQNHNEI